MENTKYDEFYNKMWNQFKNDSQLVKKNVGDLEFSIFQLYLLNGQVNNGGFSQFFYNGYASKQSEGCFSDYLDVKTHDKMLEMLEDKFSFIKDNEVFKKGIEILSKFSEIEIDIDEYIEDDETGEEVPNDNYGLVDCYTSNKLDNEWYKINEQFMNIIIESYYYIKMYL
jgi:hypothetical protein